METQRHSYLHGGKRSWASGISEDGLWEQEVFLRLMPEQLLGQFVYPADSDRIPLNHQRLGDATIVFESKAANLVIDLEQAMVDIDQHKGSR